MANFNPMMKSATCFARGAIVPRIWDTNPLYLLIEFSIALIFTECFIVKHCELPVLFIHARTNGSLVGPSQTSLSESFPALGFFTAIVRFIGFEALFFLAVSSSTDNLGFFGRFHFFLWTLLQSLNVGFVEVTREVADMLMNAAGCDLEEYQLLNLEEARPVEGHLVGDNPVRDCPIGDCPIEDRPVKEPEVSPPPPYVNALPSIAHQDPITQYTIAKNERFVN